MQRKRPVIEHYRLYFKHFFLKTTACVCLVMFLQHTGHARSRKYDALPYSSTYSSRASHWIRMGNPQESADSDNQQAIVLPLLYDPPAICHPLICLSIGSSEPMFFVVDTGSEPGIVLSYWAYEKLHLYNGERRKRTDMLQGVPFDYSEYAEPLVFHATSIGNSPDLDLSTSYILHSRKDDIFFADQFSTSHRIAGIIGMDAIGHHAIQFDLFEKTLSIYESEAALPTGTDRYILPLRDDPTVPHLFQVDLTALRERRDVSIIMRQKSSGGRSVHSPKGSAVSDQQGEWLIIDTGSSATVFSNHVFHPNQGATLLQTSISMIDGTHQAYGELLEDIELNHSLREGPIEVRWGDDTSVPSLGLNFLERFKFTILPKSHQFWLERAVNYDLVANRVAGTCGFAAVKSLQGFIVTAVEPQSSAAGSGLHLGDSITEVNGYSAANLSQLLFNLLSTGFKNDVINLTIQRKGEIVPRSLWLVSGDPYAPPVERQRLWDRGLPSIYLKTSTSALVKYQDQAQMTCPYRGVVDALPPCDALSGSHWVRVSFGSSKMVWMLVPDGALQSMIGMAANVITCGNQKTVCGIPQGSTVTIAAGGLTEVSYMSGFRYGIKDDGKIVPLDRPSTQ